MGVVLAGPWLACSSGTRPSATGSTPGLDAGTRDSGSSKDAGGSKDSPSDAEGQGDAGAQDAPSDAEGGAGDDGPGTPDGGDGGLVVEAGDGGGIPPPPAAVCSPTAVWGTGVLLAVSTSADDALDAITPDELTIAWTSGTGSTATLQVADRTSSTAAFDAPQTVPAGSFSTTRAALSHDGLHLVVVNADGQGFSELVRPSRTTPGNTFGAPAAGSYSNLGALPSGESYGDPVLSADDNAFYYSVYGAGLTSTIFRSARLLPGDAFPDGAALLPSSGLAAQGSLRRQPTAISSDEQTLFFWDQVMGTERMAFIDESTGAFDTFVDLGTRAWAAPNAACSNLYYSSEGASSVDLFVAAD